MTRERLGWIVVVLAAAALIAWVARNTYWTTVKVPLPPKGEAATNPFYIREKFAQALGARTHWARDFSLPPTSGRRLHFDVGLGPAAAAPQALRTVGRVRRAPGHRRHLDHQHRCVGDVDGSRPSEPASSPRKNRSRSRRSICSPYDEDGTNDSYLVCDMVLRHCDRPASQARVGPARSRNPTWKALASASDVAASPSSPVRRSAADALLQRRKRPTVCRHDAVATGRCHLFLLRIRPGVPAGARRAIRLAGALSHWRRARPGDLARQYPFRSPGAADRDRAPFAGGADSRHGTIHHADWQRRQRFTPQPRAP